MTKKRIAIVSNYDDEMFEEQFVNVPPMEGQLAQQICNLLNQIDPKGPSYYRPVDRDYVPYKFQP